MFGFTRFSSGAAEERIVRCCFAPPSVRNLRSSFLAISMGAPPHSHSLSILLSYSLDSSLRQTCTLCIPLVLPSWIHPKGSRKRQIMSPNAHLPTVPTLLPLLLILQWLTPLDWSTDNGLYQFTGTQTCRHTSLSLPLAQNSTASLAIHYGLNFACSMHKALAMTIVLEFPPRVLPALPGNRVPAQAGAEILAAGSGESHLTRKQTRSRHLPVSLLLLPLHTHTHNCRQAKHWEIELIYHRSLQAGDIPNLTSAQACTRSLDRGKLPQECQLPAVDKLAPPLPTARNCSGMSCLMTLCHTSGL